MKAKLHTSPVAQAFLSQEECPFCRLQREAEQRSIRFFAGPSASYMEPEIRGLTNEKGFCPSHLKKLYDYGNTLGSALMLQTHLESVIFQLKKLETTGENTGKKGLFRRKSSDEQPVWAQLEERINRCVICDQVEESIQRDLRVFFDLLAEPEFRRYVENCKGFCLPHFARLLQEADRHLPRKDADLFFAAVYRVMRENLQRVNRDLQLLIAKHDYRNTALDWGNARDSLPRAMQKLGGVDPAGAPYKKE